MEAEAEEEEEQVTRHCHTSQELSHSDTGMWMHRISIVMAPAEATEDLHWLHHWMGWVGSLASTSKLRAALGRPWPPRKVTHCTDPSATASCSNWTSCPVQWTSFSVTWSTGQQCVLFCYIDVFYKYAWAHHLTSKCGTEMADAMAAILNVMEEPPLLVQSKKRTEMHAVSFEHLLTSRVIHSTRNMDSPATTQPMVFMLPSNTNQTLYPENAATDYRVKLLCCMEVMMNVLTYTWLLGMASTQGLICFIAQHQVMPKVHFIMCGLFLLVCFHACVSIRVQSLPWF